MPKVGRPALYNGVRTKYTPFRCPEDLLTLVKAKAKKARRSLSNHLVCLIAKDTEGMEPPEAASIPTKRSR